MALNKEERAKIVAQFQRHEGDTGSPEVQVAILTFEIRNLNDHLKVHAKDFHSKRGLFMKVGQRRKMLNYLKNQDLGRYQALIDALKLRK